MEALVGYESDDGDGKMEKSYQKRESHQAPGAAAAKRRDDRSDANCQKVEMDVSDESSDSSSSSSRSSRGSPKRRDSKSKSRTRDRRSEERKRPSDAIKYRDRSRDRSRSRDRNARTEVKRNRNFGGRDDRRNDRRDDRRGRDGGNKWNSRDRRDRKRDADNSRDRRDNFRDRGGSGRGNQNRGRFRDDDHSSLSRRKDNYPRRESPPKRRSDFSRYSRDRDRESDTSSSHRRNESPKKRDERSASPKPRESRDHCNHPNQASHTSGSSTSSDANNKPAPPRTFTPNDFLTRNQRRVNEKVQQLQKMGIEIPNVTTNPLPFPAQPRPLMETIAVMPMPVPVEPAAPAVGGVLDLSHFTSPVLVNAKYTEQNQKKKLIWGSKKEQFEQAIVGDVAAKPVTTNKWEMATFSQDSDGKVASKFLRLMGMKGETVAKVAAASTADSGESNVKKREEMFSSMEQQYEVARQATHTMRGMGLGFGSQPRSF